MPLDIALRRAELGDIDQLSRLFVELDDHHIQLRPDLFKQLHGPARNLDTLRALIIDANSQAVFVAVLPSSDLLGFVHVLERHSPETVVAPATTSAEIDALAVDGAHRRNGIARALVGQAEFWAKERGIHRLVLSVRAFNVDAMQAYSAMGFEPTTYKMSRAIEE